MRGKFAALAAVGALVCAVGTAAPGVTQAQPTLVKRTTPIKHVVVLYMENHTFDNLLGYWCNDRRFRCPDGGMPSRVLLSNGARVGPSVMPDTVPYVNHNVASQLAAIDHGRMDGWQSIPGGSCSAASDYRCIGGYEPRQIPNLSALATRFAISDRTFSMADSPSWGGHIYAVAGSLDGFSGNTPRAAPGVRPRPGWGCDSDKVTGWVSSRGRKVVVPSCIPDPSLAIPNGGAFRPTPVRYIPTIMDRLDAAGLTWKIYGATKGAKGYGLWDICPTFAQCLHSGQDTNLVPDSRFMTAAAAGTLPSFSVVTPGGPDFLKSCHNRMSMTACDNWIGSLVGAVENGRDWRSTAIFITFDDFGGFYDQVPPPVNPDGTQEGPRVPLIIVSPYARAGYTDTTATTFAGILAYTEHNFRLAPLGVNDAGAYPFTNAFNYRQKPLRAVPMIIRPLPAGAPRKIAPALAADPT